MKLSEIEELKGVGPGSSEIWIEAALAALPRLLEEREMLLEALRGLDHYPHNEVSECWRAATDAIRKAES